MYNTDPDVFADKMRAAEVADDIVVVATNWNRDGGLTHPRTDNFVDFDHGNALILSGNAKYNAEVVVGITSNGEAVLYDVVDLTPATFDIKKEESDTTVTTQEAIDGINTDSSVDGSLTQPETDVKKNFSLSDSDGNQLTEEQSDYFKDSKMRDESGNLKETPLFDRFRFAWQLEKKDTIIIVSFFFVFVFARTQLNDALPSTKRCCMECKCRAVTMWYLCG